MVVDREEGLSGLVPLLHLKKLLEPQLVIEGARGFQVGDAEGDVSDPALVRRLRPTERSAGKTNQQPCQSHSVDIRIGFIIAPSSPLLDLALCSSSASLRLRGENAVYITGPIRQGTNSWWPIRSAQVRCPEATSSSRSKISRPTACTVRSR